MRLKPFLTATMIVACCLMYTPFVQATVPDGGGDPDEIPIDGGLSILIAAGVAYGAKKAYDKRKKDHKTPNDLKKVE